MYRVSRLLSRHPKPHCCLPRASFTFNSRTMHAIKGGWARQISALAKSNEKKSGVRLSKKERRVLVESFIKKYQSLNNGTFPPIHLTRKEVGGSYYIVREIVRDIIQENRVLAAPKEHQKEHKLFSSLPGDYPLGSISMEPPVSTSSLPNGMHVLDHGSSNGEVILESQKLTYHIVNDYLDIGQNAPDGKPEERFHEKYLATESFNGTYQDTEKSRLEETVEQAEPSVGMVSKISKAMEVEIFPLQASEELSESLTLSSEDAVNLNKTTKTDTDPADVDPISPIISVEDQKADPNKIGKTTNEHGLLEASDVTGSDGQKVIHFNSSAVTSVAEQGQEFTDVDPISPIISVEDQKADPNKIGKTTNEHGLLEASDVTGSDGQKVNHFNSSAVTSVAEQGQEFTANEPPAIVSNTATVKTLNGTRSDSIMKSDEKEFKEAKYEAIRSSSTDGTSDTIVKSSEPDATEAKFEAVESSTGNIRDSKPTLDRISLESWETTTRKPAHEGSPFAAFVKACMTAFSKLWSK